MGGTATKNFKYVGIDIEKKSDYTIKISQNLRNNYQPWKSQEQREYPDRRGEEHHEEDSRKAWLARKTDKTQYAVLPSGNVHKVYKRSDKWIDKCSKSSKESFTEKCYITINDLGLFEGWKIERSTDAAHGHLLDISLIMIRGAGESIAPLSWMSSNIKRVCGTTMKVKTMALV